MAGIAAKLSSRLATVAVALFSAPAFAADPDSEPPDPATDPTRSRLETVLVQARGRQETQQSVPLSVKAFSSQAIQDAGIREPADFVALTPNLSLIQTQDYGSSFITIRGLTQVRNGDPPVAVVVDDVIQTSGRQFAQQLFDLESIEVLRGPQGALYGRNASGGAILIRTRQPTNELKGYVQAGLGTGNEKAVQGSVSGAIVADVLRFRVAGAITDRAGYMDQPPIHAKADPFNNKTVRGLLSWNASDKLSIDLHASYSHDKGGTAGFNYQPTHVNADCAADLNNLFDFSLLDPNAPERVYCGNNPIQDIRSQDELTMKAEYATDLGTLRLTASHNHLSEYLALDQYPYTASRNIAPGMDGGQTQFTELRSNSLELRMTSPTRRGLRWMAGLYGLQTARFISTSTSTDLGLGVDELHYVPRFDSPTNPTLSWFANHDHNKAWAAFGNVDYDISTRVEASLALRYDHDDREQLVDYRQPAGTMPAGCTAADPAACSKQARYGALQPKASLRYKADDGSLSYASIGRGFRSGQFNQSGVGAVAASATPPIVGVTDQIGAEITTSAELGYKTLLADGRVQLNAAAFATRVSNSPYFLFVGAVGAQVLVPLNRVSLRGGELELVAQLAPGLNAYVGLGITHSRVDAYALNPSAVGNKAPYVPGSGWNVGLQQRFGVMQGLNMLLRADLSNKGREYWTPENDFSRAPVTLVDLRASLDDAGGRWSAALSIHNAADKHYNQEYVPGGFVTAAPPRVMRVSARYNF